MRKVIAGLLISLDGVVESPEKWSLGYFNDEMSEEMGAKIAMQDTVLLGRVSYQEWAGYWPTSNDEPFASFINNVPKIVVSTTLKQVEWQNATLLKGDLVKEVTKLKQQAGNDIGVQASPTLVESLLALDLLDGLRLFVHPVIAGSGRRLFQDGIAQRKLKLVEHKATSLGVLLLTYEADRNA